MGLKDTLINIKPREKAGATSASRFDFQKDWSLCQLLEHHQKDNDYLFIFDYHEDLIVMDSEATPQKVSFYQLKGKKSGNWTLTSLIESAKDTDGNPLLSIIGKLYDCKSKFALETSNLNFISNARFSFTLDDKSKALTKDTICIIELTQKDRDKIKHKLKEELSLTDDPQFEDITFLKVTELSLDDSATHSKGKLIDFLNNLKPEGKFAIPALYQNLFNEVKRRTAYSKEINSYEELVEKKGIGKSILNKWLDEVAIYTDFEQLWINIENSLIADKIPVTYKKKLKQAWVDFEIACREPNNDIVKKIKERIHNIFKSMEASNELDGLQTVACMEAIFNTYLKAPLNIPLYTDYFIKVIILVEIYG